MYLEFFNLQEFPFILTPNTHYFCNLPTYHEALNVLLFSLKSGEGFIKIVGEVGTGKTMLCRELLNQLETKNYVTAYIANPALDGFGLQKAVAQELRVRFAKTIDQHNLLNSLNRKLLRLHKAQKKIAVIIDEAQVLSDQGLEGLRLLSNLETESSKLLQIILFGQIELDWRLKQTNLRQLRQRIAFSYYLRPLNYLEVKDYVNYRLAKAGNIGGSLFSERACKKPYKASRGIPRLVNILGHKSLLAAYGCGETMVDTKAMRMAIRDTQSVR